MNTRNKQKLINYTFSCTITAIIYMILAANFPMQFPVKVSTACIMGTGATLWSVYFIWMVSVMYPKTWFSWIMMTVWYFLAAISGVVIVVAFSKKLPSLFMFFVLTFFTMLFIPVGTKKRPKKRKN